MRFERAIVDFLAISLKKSALLGLKEIYSKHTHKSNKRLLLEREPQMRKVRLRFSLAACGRNDGDSKTKDVLELLVRNFREHVVLLDTEGVVTHLVD